jgi:hypothetical protein
MVMLVIPNLDDSSRSQKNTKRRSQTDRQQLVMVNANNVDNAMTMASVQGNLMRSITQQDPFQHYDVLSEIGKGSMVRVSIVAAGGRS